ncbi:MAG: phosphatidylglycerophosphatase A [Cardiobacteriaceae bacterium]|nr:phosphatidylglycerophosphatase A [Cardiobacteriaceae bacterium]
MKNPKNFRPHTFQSLIQKPVHFLAYGLGSGLIHPAPGTWGTLMGIVLFVPLFSWLGQTGMLILSALGFALGCYLCGQTAEDLGVHDFGEIVWDEIIGVWLVLLLAPKALWAWSGWGTYVLAFLLFRLFDIVKPTPIRWFDKHLKGGLGIMVDDVLAAGYAIIITYLLAWLF